MAIPVLLATGKVAAIITTEGYTLPADGAVAASKLYSEPGLNTHVPVIMGMPYSGSRPRDLSLWPWVPPTRAIMNRANNFLSAPVNTMGVPDQTPERLSKLVKKAVSNCRSVSILAIGPFSSYNAYVKSILGKIKTVVMQGKPYDASKPESDQSFNCEYDVNACALAFNNHLSPSKHPVWVDVPRDKLPDGKYAYQPTLDMVYQLETNGLPGTIRETLLGYQGSWNAYSPDFPGGTSKLWDQSAALYFIRPNVYAQSSNGNFLTPAPSLITPVQFQSLYSSSVNHWNRLTKKSISPF